MRQRLRPHHLRVGDRVRARYYETDPWLVLEVVRVEQGRPPYGHYRRVIGRADDGSEVRLTVFMAIRRLEPAA